MADTLEMPDVRNEARIGGFTLYVYAYRKLTEDELKASAFQWLAQSRRKNFPKSGSAKMFTLFGAHEG